MACSAINSQVDVDGIYFIVNFNIHNGFGNYGKQEVTGLMAATIYGFNYIARTYLHYDANMNLLSVTHWDKAWVYGRMSALMFAAGMGNNAMVNILLDLGAGRLYKEKGCWQEKYLNIYTLIISKAFNSFLLKKSANCT